MEIKRILYPTDFSEHSEAAWPYALAFTKMCEAELFLLHVVSPPPRAYGEYAVEYDPQKLLEGMVAEAEASLQRMAEGAKSEGLILHSLVKVGTDFAEIVAAAKQEGIDLIIMGTHGRTGFSHLLLGSVAERVVRRAPCPVLTVKHPAMQAELR